MTRRKLTVDEHLVHIDHTNRAPFGRLKGVHTVAVRLADVTRTVDFIVKDNQNAVTRGLGGNRNPDG